MSLTFTHFQKINEHRCNSAFTHTVQEWTPDQWALAIAGEAGELCNYIKKCFRGDFGKDWQSNPQVLAIIAEETADVITYCDLLMTRIGANTEDEVISKFNIVSDRRKCPIKLIGE